MPGLSAGLRSGAGRLRDARREGATGDEARRALNAVGVGLAGERALAVLRVALVRHAGRIILAGQSRGARRCQLALWSGARLLRVPSGLLLRVLSWLLLRVLSGIIFYSYRV